MNNRLSVATTNLIDGF